MGDSNMQIEVFADIWCPFTHVGLRAVDEHRRRAGRTDVGIFVRSWPLELVNGAPMDPGKAAEHAVELRDQVSPQLFQHLDLAHFPVSTLDALALVCRAYRVDVKVGERASVVLRDALFEHGQDIGDPDVLRSIAAELGIGPAEDADHAAVLADLDEGRRRGVQGSPHFFCGGANVFCPSLEITRVTGSGLSITRSLSRLTDFLDGCLGGDPPA